MIISVAESGISPDHHRGLVPVLSLPPNADLIRQRAEAVSAALQGTADDIQPVFQTWREIEGNYVTYETDEVLTAMDEDARHLSALKSAGTVIAGAWGIYAAVCDDYKERHDTYMEDIIPVLNQDRELQELTGGDVGKIFETERGEELHRLISGALPELKMRGRDHQVFLDQGQMALVTAMESLDMEDLAQFAFTSRQAGLDAADSREELEFMLLESETFGSQLTMEEIRRLSGTIDLDELPYDYMDEEGRKWVTLPDGTKVRAGSAMDPNLNTAIVNAMAADPDMADVKLPTGVNEEGETQYLSAYDIAGRLVGAANDAGAGGHLPTVGSVMTLVSLGMMVNGAHGAGQAGRFNEQAVAPLMSDADLDEIEEHYATKDLTTSATKTVVSIPIGAAASATAGATFGGSYVIAYVLDEATGAVVDVIIDKVYDDTWSESEMVNRKGERIEEVDTFDEEEYRRLVEERAKEEGTAPAGEGPLNPNAPENPTIQGVPGPKPAGPAPESEGTG